MPTYIPVMGLEIHAELKTKTKMFCGCLNDPDEKVPNKNVCPICMGHPGTLPVANQAAIESMVKIGMALGAEIPMISIFDRKHYFYPDLPKGYQISQEKSPFVVGGSLKGIRINHVHLEEDAARNTHSASGTLIDYNRAGVPLMELVTEPDIRSSVQVAEFATELQLLLKYLGVSDADMEKGQMRVEVNLSLGTIVDGELKFGTKAEVKNINSFKAAVAAAEYEIKRQKEILESGGAVVQETRGWDDVQKITVSQRKKESSHDYRYFPDPDLPPVDLSRFDFKKLRLEIPELPAAKRVRFAKEYALTPEQIEQLVIDRPLANYFEAVASELKRNPAELVKKNQLAINYLSSDFKGLMAGAGIVDPIQTKINPENFADLIVLVAGEKLGSRGAKDILKKMFDEGGDPAEIMKNSGMEQVSDEGQLAAMAAEIIAAHPGPVADYKKGKEAALMFFVGKAMGALKGKGNPAVLQKIFKELLIK